MCSEHKTADQAAQALVRRNILDSIKLHGEIGGLGGHGRLLSDLSFGREAKEGRLQLVGGLYHLAGHEQCSHPKKYLDFRTSTTLTRVCIFVKENEGSEFSAGKETEATGGGWWMH